MQASEAAANAFDLFKSRWALVTAGSPENFNTCTVSWGSMGTIWTRPGKSGSIITVYLHPSRFTCEYLDKNDLFTVSFFPPEYREALGYLGSHSGRYENKVSAAGLTPLAIGRSTGFREAELTFLLRKIYAHAFSKEDIAEDVREHYLSHPASFPPDENGNWMPHRMFIGEVLEMRENPGSQT